MILKLILNVFKGSISQVHMSEHVTKHFIWKQHGIDVTNVSDATNHSVEEKMEGTIGELALPEFLVASLFIFGWLLSNQIDNLEICRRLMLFPQI